MGIRDKTKKPIEITLSILRRLMSGERLTAAELKGSGIADSTARRHLELLEQEIAEVHSSPTRPREWYFEWPTDKKSDEYTLLSLSLVRSMMTFLRGSELDVRLRDLIEDHQRRQSSNQVASDISRMFFAATRMVHPLCVDGDNIDTIVRAISKRWQLECTYQNFRGEAVRETLEPYSLIFADEGLYCYARCEDSEKTDHIDRCLLFNISRFDSIKTLRQTFVYPERDEYDPQKLFEHCFGIFVPPRGRELEEVVLLFSPKWKAYLERHKWHASQSKPQIQESGQLLVTFRLYITHDLVRWVRGFGKDVNVVSPKELCDRVAEHISTDEK